MQDYVNTFPSWNPELFLSHNLGSSFKNESQRARVRTETWVRDNMYCPMCGNSSICGYPPNKPVADFFCSKCRETFELKSLQSNSLELPRMITDGALKTMQARLRSDDNPHLFLLVHRDDAITNLFFTPKFYFSLSIIKPRKPLKPSARRAGWQGCSILYDAIPEIGKIPIVKCGRPFSFAQVGALVDRSRLLQIGHLNARGWLLDVQRCVDLVPKDVFSLEDIYRYADRLGEMHPENRHIFAKIRQQLQILRDRGLIEFISPGKYRKRYT